MAEYMNGNGLEAMHISNDYRRYEAGRSGFFTFMATGLSGLRRPDSASSAFIGDNPEDVLRLNVVKAPMATYRLNKLQYKRGNEIINMAGTPEWKNGSITVDDIVGVDTKGILHAWQALAYNVHTGAGGRMANYKKNCYLLEYTQDYQLIRKWWLVGCWISEITEQDFDKTSDAARQVSATIEYDKAILMSDGEVEYDRLNRRK